MCSVSNSNSPQVNNICTMEKELGNNNYFFYAQSPSV